jgi:hypothetical protein
VGWSDKNAVMWPPYGISGVSVGPSLMKAAVLMIPVFVKWRSNTRTAGIRYVDPISLKSSSEALGMEPTKQMGQ